MRTKSYLFGFTCIVATSILLIIFGDQRPAVQSILSETHKQLKNNIQTFKDNLKEAEEKRWTADEKYLTGLGFTTNPRLFPAAVWTNTSLPVVVSYLLDGDAELGVGLARNIAHHLPNNTLLLYNLGLGRYDLQLILSYCNTSRCTVVDLYLSDYPSHVSDHKIHAFRPIIIQDALNHAGAVFFMENNLRLTTGNIQRLIEKAKGSADEAGSGIVCWAMRQAVTSYTHPSMFHYFHTTEEEFMFLPMVEASRLLIFNTPEVHEDIVFPWIPFMFLPMVEASRLLIFNTPEVHEDIVFPWIPFMFLPMVEASRLLIFNTPEVHEDIVFPWIPFMFLPMVEASRLLIFNTPEVHTDIVFPWIPFMFLPMVEASRLLIFNTPEVHEDIVFPWIPFMFLPMVEASRLLIFNTPEVHTDIVFPWIPFMFLPMVEASRLLIFNTPEVHKDIMLPWIQCSLTHDCILPIGAQSNGCRLDKKPQYRYSGCHSHDSSALNIVLGLKFQFLDSRYTVPMPDTYFHSVTASVAAEELARLQENVTDATTDS